jgi:hypothetical protein
MSSFNVMAGGRQQVLVDEQQLQTLQAEFARRGHELDRLKAALETLSAANTPGHFIAAAMALCNELASRWKAERVGLGILQGRYVRLKALSHTEKITRHMQLVQDIESAMEECLDQDVEVTVPPPKDASFVYRFAEALAAKGGPNAVISLPLRRERKNVKEHHEERYGNVVGVLTVERKTDKPFNLAEIETLRLTCDLMTARLIDLYENDRWIGAKALRGTRRALAWAVGAKHTWTKVGAIVAAGFLAFAFFVDGHYRIEAPFTIEVRDKQILSAPFDAPLEAVYVNVIDVVLSPETAAKLEEVNAGAGIVPVVGVPKGGTVLAKLDTKQIENERAQAVLRKEIARRKQEAAMAAAFSRGDPSQISEAQKADEEIKLMEEAIKSNDELLRQATIVSRFDGIVLNAGELKMRLNSAITKGEELFQVGPLNIRAELTVSEEDILEMKAGMTGTLKATANPDRPIKYTVESVEPMATPVDGKNVYKVRATIDPESAKWLMPGVQGLSKTDVRKEKYAWIWSRRMVNWVRMQLWI